MKNNWPKIIIYVTILFIIILFWWFNQNITNILKNNKIWLDFFIAFGTVTVSVIALWPTIKRILLSIKLTVGIDEKIKIVISEDGEIRKLQLGINLINTGNKDFLLQRMAVELIKRGDAIYSFDWNLFIQDLLGQGTIPEKRPVPIYLKTGDSIYQMIQFFRENPITLIEGEYSIKIKIWAEQNDIVENPRFTYQYTFIFNQEDSIKIEKERGEIKQKKPPLWRLVDVSIKNWDFKRL